MPEVQYLLTSSLLEDVQLVLNVRNVQSTEAAVTAACVTLQVLGTASAVSTHVASVQTAARTWQTLGTPACEAKYCCKCWAHQACLTACK